MFGLSPLLENASVKVKLVAAVISLILTASAFVAGGKALWSVPGKLDQHSVQTKVLNNTLDKMLCIQVADHRKMDWNLCFINPTEVLPTQP